MGACCSCPETSTLGVIEKFGKFQRFAEPGFNFLCCCCGEFQTGKISLRLQQLDVSCETKTKDNVFVTIFVAVQYEVVKANVYDAYYKLTDPHTQIRSYVFDVVRSTVPKIKLDDVFEVKDDIAQAVKTELTKVIGAFGYDIHSALVTDIVPDARVKQAMNEINAAARLRVAAVDKAEAEKVRIVKGAEADAESKYLAGVGISRQRQAIVNGLRESVVMFSENVKDTSPRDVMDLMMITQYFDTLRDIGMHNKSTAVFMPHEPGAIGSVAAQIRQGALQARLGVPEAPTMTRITSEHH
eukprot:jgi/Chlat1/7841/Chrsp66S07286